MGVEVDPARRVHSLAAACECLQSSFFPAISTPETRFTPQGATSEGKRPDKRRKAGNPSRNTEVGPKSMTPVVNEALKGFVGTPLDIMFEVFGQIHPLDLLHMAWTSKDLRKIILSRSSASVWRRSLSTVEDLPKCLVGMNEPQYAHLMFDETCHLCGAGNAKHVILLARLRCCNICAPRRFTLLASPPFGIIPPIFSITPYIEIDWAMSLSFPPSRHRQVLIIRLTSTGYTCQGMKYYYMEEMYKLQAEYFEIRDPFLQSAWILEKQTKLRALEQAAPAYTKFLNKALTQNRLEHLFQLPLRQFGLS
ncbi:hypothetical protein CVT26_003127 [Gymnopilus dilepis]|uniref:F-box domain-containing protein n=1 Tax=Gymnopilus dilepis TaxID=231916 RepID=A0A409Y4T5_9AGAR|nr:hypothetical protein CVT26_003127 [Gymnopilus dilepis]